ncbi:MAG: PqqD family protein [Candidatus Acidulodesulfobacterium acidiphilum]|uniref:PqqD family protein n=1 Tax=Candidatus Acidulodesulfobacterium acidiphilum TaxID=2597224 RepID=A0A520XGZ0_9DELT|nr:MAG: PqqD family protein [Candidatus Acidulodesulfobacterium acidiphilum]
MLKLADTVSIKQDETYYIFFDNETGDIYKLNEISYKILSLCDGSTTNEDILSTIMQEFNVTYQEAKKDFDKLIQTLLSKKYIYNNE